MQKHACIMQNDCLQRQLAAVYVRLPAEGLP